MYLDLVKNSLTDRIELSSQNSWVGKGGAFTGEIRLVYSLFRENMLAISSQDTLFNDKCSM